MHFCFAEILNKQVGCAVGGWLHTWGRFSRLFRRTQWLKLVWLYILILILLWHQCRRDHFSLQKCHAEKHAILTLIFWEIADGCIAPKPQYCMGGAIAPFPRPHSRGGHLDCQVLRAPWYLSSALASCCRTSDTQNIGGTRESWDIVMSAYRYPHGFAPRVGLSLCIVYSIPITQRPIKKIIFGGLSIIISWLTVPCYDARQCHGVVIYTMSQIYATKFFVHIFAKRRLISNYFHSHTP